ncbi:MAG: hypothetical protein WCV71_02640 [Patescibacteria group bacterium]
MKFKNYKLVSKWPYLATIFALIVVVPMKISAISPLVKLLVQPIWNFFVWPLTWTIQLEMELLRLVARYNNFTNEGGVMLGWIALRDLSNMFFILILLVIAFATILRISNYGYQQLLKKTFIIAILINFSKTIVGFMIDVVQVVMLTFISAIDEVMAGGVVVAIGLHKLTQIQLPGDGVPMEDYVLALVMGAVFLAILVVVMGVMVMMLMMRIVALWVAIVLAPLAFVASIFPATKSFYSRWIKELGTNLVTGPMLAFFMWLTFTIVGNGEAYRTFLNDNPSMPGPTEFLGTANMVNYVVAISLLLMGIKMASASGAAGASFAAKGMGMINNTASKLARRYPMAVGKRLANWAAGGVVDKDGKARPLLQMGANRIINSRLGKRMNLTERATDFSERADSLRASNNILAQAAGRTMTGARDFQWNRIPFYGGRVQRGAMKAQGKYSAMVDEFQAEDEKFINPKQREQFEASQDNVKGGPKFLSRVPILNRSRRLRELGLGDAAGNVTSLGGNADRRVMQSKTKLDRGDIADQAEADFVAENLERVNDQSRLDKLHKQWGSTYRDKADVDKDINQDGIQSLLRDQKADAAIDPETGLPYEGSRLLIEGAFRDTDSVGLDIGKAILSKFKTARVAWSKALAHVAQTMGHTMERTEENLKNYGTVAATEINPATGMREIGFNNKSVVELNAYHPMVKAVGSTTQVYPQQAVNPYNEAMDHLEQGVIDGFYNFDAASINYLKQRSKEPDKDFEVRKKAATDSWEQNTASFEAGHITAEEMYKHRRQTLGVYTPEEIETEAAPIRARMQNLEAGRASGSISEEQYNDDLEIEKKALKDLYDSPIARIAGNSDDIELAMQISSRLPDKPIRGTAQLEKVEDAEIEEKTKKKVSEISETEITKRVKASGQTFTDPVNEKQARARVRQDMEEEIRGKTRDSLVQEKGTKRDEEQKKIDDKYNKDLANYNTERDALRRTIGEALTSIAKDKDATRLGNIQVEIDGARSSNDTDRLAKLLAEQNTLTRLQNTKRREALGLATPNTKNIFSRALLKDATDGADYSRLQEMDINVESERHLFIELAKVATPDQQRQLFQEANPDQLKLFAEVLASTGQKLNKVIVDNLTPAVKKEIFRMMHTIKLTQEGVMSAIEIKEFVAKMTDEQLAKIK